MRCLALLAVTLSAISFAAELKLGEVTASVNSAPMQIQLSLSDAGQLALRIDSTTAVLETKPITKADRLHALYPLKSEALKISGADGALITFGLEDGQGGARLISAAVIRDGKNWKIANEWAVECGPLGSLGLRRESQQFEAAAPDQLIRRAKRLTMEGVEAKLDCGCTVCNSRTTDLVETETYLWNKTSGKFERSALERRYVVQPGEGLMSIARKALGDARLMARLYRLNPELKAESVLQPGQQLLIERQ